MSCVGPGLSKLWCSPLSVEVEYPGLLWATFQGSTQGCSVFIHSQVQLLQQVCCLLSKHETGWWQAEEIYASVSGVGTSHLLYSFFSPVLLVAHCRPLDFNPIYWQFDSEAPPDGQSDRKRSQVNVVNLSGSPWVQKPKWCMLSTVVQTNSLWRQSAELAGYIHNREIDSKQNKRKAKTQGIQYNSI